MVDWELCTIGEPLADLGLLMVYWREAGDEQIPLITPATVEPGFPTRAELADLYAEITGRDISKLDYFVALGFWKAGDHRRRRARPFRRWPVRRRHRRRGRALWATIDLLVGRADEAINRINKQVGRGPTRWRSGRLTVRGGPLLWEPSDYTRCPEVRPPDRWGGPFLQEPSTSRLAMTILWTSSGPSASFSMRL